MTRGFYLTAITAICTTSCEDTAIYSGCAVGISDIRPNNHLATVTAISCARINGDVLPYVCRSGLIGTITSLPITTNKNISPTKSTADI